MVQKRSTALLALPLAGSLLLAGCSGDAKKPPGSAASTSTTPPSSSTTAPAPTTSTPPRTTTEAAPTIPPAAKQHTKAGAEAFVRFYFDEVNRAWTTPDASRLGDYAKPSCKSCAASLVTANKLVVTQQRYDGNPVTLQTVSAALDVATNTYKVSTSIIQERRNVLDSHDKVVLTDKQMELTLVAALVWTAGRWLIETVKRAA